MVKKNSEYVASCGDSQDDCLQDHYGGDDGMYCCHASGLKEGHIKGEEEVMNSLPAPATPGLLYYPNPNRGSNHETVRLERTQRRS